MKTVLETLNELKVGQEINTTFGCAAVITALGAAPDLFDGIFFDIEFVTIFVPSEEIENLSQESIDLLLSYLGVENKEDYDALYNEEDGSYAIPFGVSTKGEFVYTGPKEGGMFFALHIADIEGVDTENISDLGLSEEDDFDEE